MSTKFKIITIDPNAVAAPAPTPSVPAVVATPSVPLAPSAKGPHVAVTVETVRAIRADLESFAKDMEVPLEPVATFFTRVRQKLDADWMRRVPPNSYGSHTHSMTPNAHTHSLDPYYSPSQAQQEYWYREQQRVRDEEYRKRLNEVPYIKPMKRSSWLGDW